MDQSNTESRVRAWFDRQTPTRTIGARLSRAADAEVLAINDARAPKHVHLCGRP